MGEGGLSLETVGHQGRQAQSRHDRAGKAVPVSLSGITPTPKALLFLGMSHLR